MSKERFCPECGQPVDADERFCRDCGAEVPFESDNDAIIAEVARDKVKPTATKEPIIGAGAVQTSPGEFIKLPPPTLILTHRAWTTPPL